jgi:hypothetical protein
MNINNIMRQQQKRDIERVASSAKLSSEPATYASERSSDSTSDTSPGSVMPALALLAHAAATTPALARTALATRACGRSERIAMAASHKRKRPTAANKTRSMVYSKVDGPQTFSAAADRIGPWKEE